MKTLALILALFWMPVTSWCLAERAALYLTAECCPSSSVPSDSEPPGESVCCSLASPNYKSDDQLELIELKLAADLVPEPLLAPLLCTPPPAGVSVSCVSASAPLSEAPLLGLNRAPRPPPFGC